VRDTGQGIPADFLPHVFDRFRQASGIPNKRYEGLGLGLAIVQHLVNLHGGTVRAESGGEDQGALFTVKLPLAIGDIETQISKAAAPSEWGDEFQCVDALDDLRLLIVEDDLDTRELLTFMLEECGAKVISVGSAREAIDILTTSTIDVLVSDIAIPDDDGYELMRQVRLLSNEKSRAVPAVALTAYATEEDRKRALAAGFQLHLAKPVEPNQLIAAISHLARTKTSG
jgi:CheY-like chemotaxis protein